MKVTYKPTPTISIEVDASGVKEMFEVLGPVQEVMENRTCGKCGGDKLRFVHRKDAKGHNYYELLCQSAVQREDSSGQIITNKKFPCGAKLSFGQSGEKLFPRRYEQDPNDKKVALVKDGKKVWLPDRGWTKWDGTKNV